MNDFENNSANQKIAVVDIGANSVRMMIYDVNTETGGFTVCDSARHMLGLAGYISEGCLSPDGAGKLFAVLREYLARANDALSDTFYVFATASLRGLSNSARICDNIKKKLGIDIKIISGKEEAMYDFAAIAAKFDVSRRGALVDMGGGSTEIVLFENGSPVNYVSLPIGCLALAKKYVKNPPCVNAEEQNKIKKYARDIFSSLDGFRGFADTVYLIGGTARAVTRITAAVSLDGAEESSPFDAEDLLSVGEKLQKDRRLCRKMTDEHSPDRKLSVMAGYIALGETVRYLGAKKIITSGTGVRDGFLLRKIEEIKTQNG